jgi:hypothetical protein
VIVESENVSRETSVPRHLSAFETYNEGGNLERRVSFDYNGYPEQISVLGYLDSMRVSKLIRVRKDETDMGPPPPMPLNTKPDKADPRISFSYRYSYVKGNLAEVQIYDNYGVLNTRYTYTRNGNSLEKLLYSGKDRLYQKYLCELDDRENEISESVFDLTGEKIFGDKKYVYKYDALDKSGNWSRKSTFQVTIVDGKEVLKPLSIHYRTIAYFD